MFVFSIKAGKKQVYATLACVAMVAVIAVAALLSPTASQPMAGKPSVNLSAATEEERAQLLKNLGCETDNQAPDVREVRIPDEPDEVFTRYNELQKQSGMDLERCLGKRVKVYTYHVLNSAESGTAQANLYVYNGKAVAGDITVLGENAVSQPLFPLL